MNIGEKATKKIAKYLRFRYIRITVCLDDTLIDMQKLVRLLVNLVNSIRKESLENFTLQVVVFR